MDDDERTKRGGGEGESDFGGEWEDPVADRVTVEELEGGGEVEGFKGECVKTFDDRTRSASGTSSSTAS